MKIVIWLLKFRLALASLEVLWLFLLETTAFISLAFNRASSPHQPTSCGLVCQTCLDQILPALPWPRLLGM